MRAAFCSVLAALLSGCGYVGDPLPPALHIPTRVTEVSAIQRAGTIEIRFTAPVQTTDDLIIRRFESVDVRIGPAAPGSDLDAWAVTATPVQTPLPKPGEAVTVKVPAEPWAGRNVAIAVRFVSTRGRASDWSNPVTITPRAPLPAPALRAELHPEGVRLSWGGKGQARVYRGDDLLGTAAGEFIDRDVELGRVYTYRAQALEGAAESELSGEVSITIRDLFPPRPPSGVTAVVALDSVELAWEPSTAPDLSGYRVRRAAGSSEFEVIADAVDKPFYSDRTATEPGTYRYQVTAIDRSGNESAPSAVVEVTR